MKETSTVRGKVIRLSGEPLGKAEVTLTRHEPMSRVRYAAISDAGGEFLLEDVEPGEYRLDFTRNGFVKESAEWFGGATLLTLAAGKQLEGITIRMAPQAAISGRVTDEDGDPVADVPITLFRELEGQPGRNLVPIGGQVRSTNDLGEFRIPGLVSGRYFLCALGSAPASSHGRQNARGTSGSAAAETYPPWYFPGTTDAAQASPIEVAAGEELHGFDLALKKVRSFRVRGRAELPPGADVRALHVNLGPHHVGTVAWGFGIGSRAGDFDRGGGADFDIGGVLPGSYNLMAHCQVAQQARTAHVRVEVIDRDVEGVVVNFSSGLTVAGVVRAADDSGRLNPAYVHISLGPAEPGIMSVGGASPDAAGGFALYDVAPGRYRVGVHLLQQDGYLKSVLYADREVSDYGIEIAEGTAGKLDVLIAFDGGELTGTVEDGNGVPLPGAVVRLVTDPPRLDQKFAQTDQDGRFWLRGIRPGDYWLFALESVEASVPFGQPWEQLGDFARKVTVSANSHEDLRISTRKS